MPGGGHVATSDVTVPIGISCQNTVPNFDAGVAVHAVNRCVSNVACDCGGLYSDQPTDVTNCTSSRAVGVTTADGGIDEVYIAIVVVNTIPIIDQCPLLKAQRARAVIDAILILLGHKP